MTLDKNVFESMTKEIQVELSNLVNLQEKLLNNLSNYISDKVYLERQKTFAEQLVKELDEDYIFSVENISDDKLECPLCGVVHDNSLINRASILSDKQEAKDQLSTLHSKLKLIDDKIKKVENQSIEVKSKIEDINSKYMIVDDSKEVQLNEIIETFAYKSIDRNINATKKEKLSNIHDCIANQKSIKKDQKELLTKERKEEINNSFMDLLKTYIKILNVEEINLSKITTPLNYNSIIKEGGAAESIRGILAYYLAIYSLVDIYSDEVVAPLIVDTPNQQEQSYENYGNIIKLLTTKIPKDKQVILCAMENETLKDFEKDAHVIELNKDRLLDKAKYEKIKKNFDEIETKNI